MKQWQDFRDDSWDKVPKNTPELTNEWIPKILGNKEKVTPFEYGHFWYLPVKFVYGVFD